MLMLSGQSRHTYMKGRVLESRSWNTLLRYEQILPEHNAEDAILLVDSVTDIFTISKVPGF